MEYLKTGTWCCEVILHYFIMKSNWGGSACSLGTWRSAQRLHMPTFAGNLCFFFGVALAVTRIDNPLAPSLCQNKSKKKKKNLARVRGGVSVTYFMNASGFSVHCFMGFWTSEQARASFILEPPLLILLINFRLSDPRLAKKKKEKEERKKKTPQKMRHWLFLLQKSLHFLHKRTEGGCGSSPCYSTTLPTPFVSCDGKSCNVGFLCLFGGGGGLSLSTS